MANLIMKRVYLDQNKWIDLASAKAGLDKGQRYADVLALAAAGVDRGLLSLPLSSVHYIETANRREWKSRSQLAETMAELSRFQTIAPQSALVPPELDRAFNGLCGRPTDLLPLRPFGLGFAHAFDATPRLYGAPESVPLPDGARWKLENDLRRLQEWVALSGPPPGFADKLEGYDPKAHLPIARKYAEDKENLRALRVAEGWNRGERADRVAAAEAFANFLDPLNEALERARLSASALYATGRDGLTALLKAIPTIHASKELERQRHTASQKAWEANDLGDLAALPGAVVYCDIVVTERVWTDAIRRAKLDETNQTVVLSKLEELPAHLV